MNCITIPLSRAKSKRHRRYILCDHFTFAGASASHWSKKTTNEYCKILTIVYHPARAASRIYACDQRTALRTIRRYGKIAQTFMPCSARYEPEEPFGAE